MKLKSLNRRQLPVGRVNRCWFSPGQLFLVSNHAGLKTVFYCLTALEDMQLHWKNIENIFSIVPLLFRVHSFQRKYVYRAVAL
jgi:hypothetical protein